MKRRAEFLVEKRDGRRVWLRATKLAHSILLALQSGQIEEPWRAVDLASSVLTGLRSVHGEKTVLSTELLADAVQRVLTATGFHVAAGAYELVGAEQRRRRLTLSGGAWCRERLPGHDLPNMVGRSPAEGPFRG